jgi:signal transduction histidine kinase/CheY-like chemotaxis protein
MVFEALSKYLRDNSERLMEQWRARVRKDRNQPACRHHLRGKELDDHLPSLLQMIADALVDVAAPPALDREAREHGRQRRGHGYSPVELIEEFAVFRDTILHAIEAYNESASTPLSVAELGSARLQVITLLDRSIGASMRQWMEEAEHARVIADQRLLASNAALREADALKDRFVTILSHELRNPLAPILSAAQVLDRILPDDPTMRTARDIIERQTRQLMNLVDDLLDLTRVSTGKIVLKSSVMSLQDAVGTAVESCRPSIDEHQLQLTMAADEQPLHIFADSTRIVQVATNILNNACKFTPRGGSIHVDVKRSDGEAVLSVRDSGIGIPPQMLERVFELFAQGDASLNRGTGGLGIGLTVTRSLVEMQGGRIEAHSSGENTGAEFVIRFPLALSVPAASPSDHEKVPDTDGSPTAKRIAVVEDNDDSRDALGTLLRLFGHVVFPAANGEEALRLAAADRPDVFIIDIGLPSMNGYELARALRSTPACESAILIALSGYGNNDDKNRAFDAGFDFHLTKPADVEQLNRLLGGTVAP